MSEYSVSAVMFYLRLVMVDTTEIVIVYNHVLRFIQSSCTHLFYDVACNAYTRITLKT